MDDSVSLPVIFKTACRLHEQLDSYEGSSGDESFQKTVKSVIDGFERTTRLVNSLGLFSNNEQLEDVPTNSMRYLLCPAYLMDATMKLAGMDERVGNVRAAKVYAEDFLTRCKDYGITAEGGDANGVVELAAGAVASFGQASSSTSASARMQAMAAQRQTVLDQHRQKKELEARIKELAKRIDDAGDSADDELERDFNKTRLRYWINKTKCDIRLLDQELQVLEHMEKMKQQGGPRPAAATQEPPPERRPFKPVVITREKIKAGVFGKGYPGQPTMTLDEFYEAEYAPIVKEYEDKQEEERIHAERVRRGLEENPDEQPVEDDDADEDDKKLYRQRNKDDWKDDHRRGYGNRHNRS